MTADKFELRWVCYYEPEHKLWGWFINPKELSSNEQLNRWGMKNCYCFWAVCGKTISLNKHLSLTHNMDRLQDKKLANKYQRISEDELIAMWPSFHEDLQNRFIFAKLSEQI